MSWLLTLIPSPAVAVLLALLDNWDVPMAVSLLPPILCGIGAISAKVGLAKEAK